jgi:hypothetical protein
MAEKKPWLTPYNYCSNNPLNRIDPTGMDDYFNSKGQYMYSTKTGSRIMVETPNGHVSLSKLNVFAGDAQAISNITTYYAEKIGMNTPVKAGFNPKGTAFTRGKNIYINVWAAGSIIEELDDAYAPENTLYHEEVHKKKGHGFSEEGKEVSDMEHASVYYEQVNHPTFAKSPSGFQKGTLKSMKGYISNAVNNPNATSQTEENARLLVNKTNEALKAAGINYMMQIKYEVNIYTIVLKEHKW